MVTKIHVNPGMRRRWIARIALCAIFAAFLIETNTAQVSDKNVILGPWKGRITIKNTKKGDTDRGDVTMELTSQGEKILGSIQTDDDVFTITKVGFASGKWEILWSSTKGANGKFDATLTSDKLIGECVLGDINITFEMTRGILAKQSTEKPIEITNPEGKKISATKSSLNQKAPDFVVEKWMSEKPSLEGKFLLIDFWATWCGPCIGAIPEANKLHRRFKEKLVVIGISDEPEDVVRKFTKPAMECYSAIDTKARTKTGLSVTAIPYMVIIDPNGIVRFEGDPFLHHNIQMNQEMMEKAVEEIIAKYSK